jgi:dTDP-L-rhamnose 4-epimerase
MAERILITGGAGFIGSHLADELLAAGYQVRVLDNLTEQVHGRDPSRPTYVSPEVEFIAGDIRDSEAVSRSLENVDAVVHLAARVGVGQSMYAIDEYVDANERGTAVLLQALIDRPVRKLMVASSMSIYGEGLYANGGGAPREDVERTTEQLQQHRWDPIDEQGRALRPLPTPESKRPQLASVYALSKYVQERMCLVAGRAYGMPTMALRFFNVYGPRQALSNPYTGVLAIFASRLLNHKRPVIFEDGLQQRDFVHVKDVTRACRLALERDCTDAVVNIGSGEAYTIRQVAERLALALGRNDIGPEITGQFRAGDIRHCFADISEARRLLGYEPSVKLDDGLKELTGWLADQAAVDRFDEARSELLRRGLSA